MGDIPVRRSWQPIVTTHAPESEALQRLLQLSTAPVAVQFRRSLPAGMDRAGADLKACMYLDTARFERRVFYADGANMAPCPGGRHYMGQGAAFPALLDGSFPSGDFPGSGIAVFGNAEAVRRTFGHYAIMPEGEVAAVCFGPLDLVRFDPADGPVTVVVFAAAKTAMVLTRAVTYESGGVVSGPIGPPTCSVVMAQPALGGEATFTLGCFGFRRYVRIGVDQVVVGLPLALLASTVANLERFYARRPDIAASLALNEAEAMPPALAGTAVGTLYRRMLDGDDGA